MFLPNVCQGLLKLLDQNVDKVHQRTNEVRCPVGLLGEINAVLQEINRDNVPRIINKHYIFFLHFLIFQPNFLKTFNVFIN